MEDFLKTINIFQYELFREHVVKACNISMASWSYWRNGGTVSRKYKPIINIVAVDMFGRKVFTEGGDQ